MRIALALSGLPRLYPISIASWARIGGAYRPDVYIHSWYDPDGLEHHIKSQLEWMFKTKDCQLEPLPSIDVSPFPDRHWPNISVYNSLSMWTGVKRAHQMVIDSGIEYDLIIRGRLDLHIHWLDLMAFDGIVVPFCPFKLDLKFNYRGVDMHGYNDHLAYGNRYYMDKYVSTADEILSLYRDELVDYCPENFLAANLVKQEVPVMMQSLQHCLIRS